MIKNQSPYIYRKNNSIHKKMQMLTYAYKIIIIILHDPINGSGTNYLEKKMNFAVEEWPSYTTKNYCINKHVVLFLIQIKQKEKGIRLKPLKSIRVSSMNDLLNHDLPIQASFLYLKIRLGVCLCSKRKRISFFFWVTLLFSESQEKIFLKTSEKFYVYSQP